MAKNQEEQPKVEPQVTPQPQPAAGEPKKAAKVFKGVPHYASRRKK